MNVKIAEGVNYDYILVLCLNDENKLELRRVPIKRSMSLINGLLSYYEDSNYDIVDMFNALNRGTYTYMSYKYCLSHNYTDSYISEVKYPELDVSKYRKEEKELCVVIKVLIFVNYMRCVVKLKVEIDKFARKSI